MFTYSLIAAWRLLANFRKVAPPPTSGLVDLALMCPCLFGLTSQFRTGSSNYHLILIIYVPHNSVMSSLCSRHIYPQFPCMRTSLHVMPEVLLILYPEYWAYTFNTSIRFLALKRLQPEVFFLEIHCIWLWNGFVFKWARENKKWDTENKRNKNSWTVRFGAWCKNIGSRFQ